MADDIPFANGAGPAPRPRRRMYAAPFGALQNDAGDIQFGNGTGPAPREPVNALAVRPKWRIPIPGRVETTSRT
jgi:hypothetical protein